ncbi:unnamed protein product [Closterium sp. Yama58-4]|nr:unnamed protein product [Closterium sp. Yama58-4]
MARMTAVAMLLPGLLAAVLPAIPVIVSIMLRARDAWPFTTAKDVSAAMPRIAAMSRVTRGNQQVNHPFALPSASISDPSGANHLLVLYSVISTLIASLMALLWGMGVTHTQVRAWLCQQGLAWCAVSISSNAAEHLSTISHPSPHSSTPFTAIPLALTMLQPCGIFPLLHSPMKRVCFGMKRVGEVVVSVTASMGGTHEGKEVMEMRMRALGVQLEETRRELAASRGEVTAVKGEFVAVKGEFVAVKDETEMRLRALGMQLEETRSELEEVERRRAAEMREMRGQGEEREGKLASALAAVKVELATVQGEVAEHKQSNRLQLEQAERRRVAEMRGQVEEREREVAAVKGELAAHKEGMKEKWDVAERRRQSDLIELREEVRKKEDEMRQELAREKEERRREVQDVERRTAAELRGQVKKRERELAEKESALNALMTLHALRKLVQSEGKQETAWERIEAASRATSVSLANIDGLSDDMLRRVSTMSQLKFIDLERSSGFSAEGIKHLYRLPRLELLDLDGTGVPDSALEGIESLTNLEQLYLQQTKVTDGGLRHLRGLSCLKALLLSRCNGVTNAGMVHVGRLTGLEKLALDGTSVTNDGLKQLSALTRLKTLWPPEGGKRENDDVRRRIGR